MNFQTSTPPGTSGLSQIEPQTAYLARNLEVPDDPKGLVVLCHSDTHSRREPRRLYIAQCLGVKGLAVLDVDLVASGEEVGMPWRAPENLQLMVARITAAVRWVRQQPGMVKLSVGCLGVGVGGTAALMAAAALTAAIDAVVIIDGLPEFAGDRLSSIIAATQLIVSDGEDVHRRMNEIAFTRLNCEKDLAILSHNLDEFDGQNFEQIGVLAAGWFHKHLAPCDRIVARAGQPESTS